MAEDYDIGKAFEVIEDELIASMIRNMKRHRAEELEKGYEWSQWQVEQLKALEIYKKCNQKKYQAQFKSINAQIEGLIRIAKQEGGMSQEAAILKAIKNGFTGYHRAAKGMTAEFFRLNERKLDALIKATLNDMQKAETAILRMANDRYRKAIYNAQVYANTGAGTYEKAVDMATKDMLAAGLNCVEYTNGARHRLAVYADMAIRTASKRAYLQGEGEKRMEWGVTTVIMNKRGNPCPKCLPFVGKVLIDDVWSGGSSEDGDYPLMSKAIAAGLYHPNCRDSHTTYFPGISTADDTWTLKELEAVEKAYQKSQRRQYCRHEAKKYDRLAKYSLDEENQRVYKHRADAWKEESLRTKASQGEYGVKWDIVRSKEYTERFNAISENPKANLLAAQRSRNALRNRDGRNTEELYAISLTSGKDIASITNQHNAFGVKRTSKFDSDVLRAEKNGERILLIHNHPKSGVPSIVDLNELLTHKNAVGITVGHNGNIYYYTKPKQIVTDFDFYVALRKSKAYNTDMAYEEALSELAKQFKFEFRKL